MRNLKKFLTICGAGCLLWGLNSDSNIENNNHPILLDQESVEQWSLEMDGFLKKFIHQARFAQLAKPHRLNEKEVFEFFSIYLRGAESVNKKELSRHFLFLCKKYQMDPALVLGIIFVESRFNLKALSPVGARGLMQVMPDTARYISQRTGILYEKKEDLYDPFLSLTLGIYYLSYLRDKFENNLYLTLMAYNMGPNRIVKDINSGKRGYDFQSEVHKNSYYQLILDALEKFNFET